MPAGAQTTGPGAAPTATVIIVTYRTQSVDLSWLPESVPVLIVQNDTWFRAEGVAHAHARLLGTRTNVGFGAGVNDALPFVDTPRVVLVNPDTVLTAEHWNPLAAAADHEIVVVPLNDSRSHPTSVVSAYPTPLSLLLTAMRVGRFVPRSSRRRQVLARLFGKWGRSHASSLSASGRVGRWPLTTHWPAAAVCSYPTDAIRAVAGFDPGYFLYLEDTDLARRLADARPNLEVVVADVTPGTHHVGGSAPDGESRRRVQVEQARSASRYARTQPGLSWKAAAAATSWVAWIEGR